LIYDVSNACLGLLDGVLQVANMIELGQIRAGLVVGTEDSRYLLETTIAQLNADLSLTRQQIKRAVASLTIGSASCAILLVDRDQSQTGNRLLAASSLAHTRHHGLCHSGQDEAIASGMSPLMDTDSETLMRQGIATGVATFETFLRQTGWRREQIQRTVCHQVGAGHRKAMLEALGIDIERDFSSVHWLGNTGSVALPVTMALACQSGFVQADQRVAMLGIGSGINCLMLAVQWQESRVRAGSTAGIPMEQPHELPSSA
jgi:3-oxoacyl-[acyl-carrier-protein] synthase-3